MIGADNLSGRRAPDDGNVPAFCIGLPDGFRIVEEADGIAVSVNGFEQAHQAFRVFGLKRVDGKRFLSEGFLIFCFRRHKGFFLSGWIQDHQPWRSIKSYKERATIPIPISFQWSMSYQAEKWLGWDAKSACRSQ